MRCVLVGIALLVICAAPSSAQDREADLRARYPYERMAVQYPGLTVDDYDRVIRILAQMPDLVAEVSRLPIRPLTAVPSTIAAPPTTRSTTASVALTNPPPPRPATPPVPRITYPTTRGIYEWEAAHLSRR